MTREITTVVSDLSYLECPRWHDGRIWFVDFYTHRVLSATADGGDLRTEAEVPAQPSGLGWLPDGRLIVVSMRDHRILRREADGTLVTHAELAGHVTGLANDMVVDADGRAYVGNFGFDLMNGAPLAPTVLVRADPDGTVTTVAEDLWFPNGSVITDEGVLLVDETFGNRITAFDLHDGELTNRRTWASFGDLPKERELPGALGQIVVAPDGCGWMPRAPCGWPTAWRPARSACARAARSSNRSRSGPACSPACSAVTMAARCSPALPPTSTNTPAAPPARPGSSPSASTSRTPDAPDWRSNPSSAGACGAAVR